MFILKRKPAALDVVGSRGVKLFQPLVGDNPLLPSCEAVFSGKKKRLIFHSESVVLFFHNISFLENIPVP